MVQVSRPQGMALVKANNGLKPKNLFLGRILGSLSINRQKTLVTDSATELNEAVGFGPLWSEYDMWL